MGQTVFRGVGSYERILDIIFELNVRKPLVVCGKSFEHMKVNGFLMQSGVNIAKFRDFGSNPVFEDICKGVALFNQQGCDALLAVGGGSAIDVAKCIKLFSSIDLTSFPSSQKYADTTIPIIAMPTTAGTGSESTRYAVIYLNGEKQSITHSSIIPDYVILDSSALKSLSVYQKKCTLMDALCQGIESWWSVNSTEESKKFSKAAVEGIMADWQKYIEENSEEAADGILYSANLAGQAINITATTAPHAMSYKLTSIYGLPHGHAVALCLLEVWKYMASHIEDCIDRRGERYIQDVFDEINKSICIEEFCKLIITLKLDKPKLKSVDDLMILTESVNEERLKNNPIALSKNSIRKLYERITGYEG